MEGIHPSFFMETWNSFTSNDLLYTLFGAAGLGSVVLVLRTALGNVNKREISRAQINKAIQEKIKEVEEAAAADK